MKPFVKMNGTWFAVVCSWFLYGMAIFMDWSHVSIHVSPLCECSITNWILVWSRDLMNWWDVFLQNVFTWKLSVTNIAFMGFFPFMNFRNMCVHFRHFWKTSLTHRYHMYMTLAFHELRCFWMLSFLVDVFSQIVNS